jgi:hypothetical protein
MSTLFFLVYSANESQSPNAVVLLWEAKEGFPHWARVEVLHPVEAFGVLIQPASPVLV